MRNKYASRIIILCIFISATICFPEDPSAAEKRHHSPYVSRDYPMQVYWGDTHLHTNYSVDAYAWGSAITPDEAYRFARGETVTAPGGVPIRRRRPLDFLVVADHAENLGVLPALEANHMALLATESGRQWHKELQDVLPTLRKHRESRAAYDGDSVGTLFPALEVDTGVVGGDTFRRSVWQEVTSRADQYNEPGKFTAFSGYEWTPLTLFIHRVVVFKDDAATAGQMLPFSQFDSTRPEDLWAHLEEYTRRTGGDVLAIPHNPNLTRGLMFLPEDSSGKPFTADYAKIRSRWEPLLEVSQHKGDSETHPELSPTDDFADYERWGAYFTKPTEERGRQYEYARSALKLGLDQQAAVGVNPFKFGMIGGTDSHSALSSVDSSNFWAMNPYGPSIVTEAYPYSFQDPKLWEPYFFAKLNVASYAGVWARENTREAVFEAMKRREVYATTGSRIELRIFGGWNYEDADALKPDVAVVGYSKGVPMGGDLPQGPPGRTSSFLVRAVKDPLGPNLDRVQVIKGWRDAKGELHERIYNVALSDGRQETPDGQVPEVGSTVNVKDASYTNAIGDPELAVVWQDPHFNPDEMAFYYMRVIEIPTPRWTTYYAKTFEIEKMPPGIPMVTQQRAYSSPIWYTPRAK